MGIDNARRLPMAERIAFMIGAAAMPRQRRAAEPQHPRQRRRAAAMHAEDEQRGALGRLYQGIRSEGPR